MPSIMQSPDRRPAASHPAAPAVKLSPSTGTPMRLVQGEPTNYTFRNVQFTATGLMWECPDTEQRYSTPDQVDAVLAQVHRQWRAHLGIGRTALRERRLALGISAAQASALLCFGINQYSTYETTDKLPSKSNAHLLQLLCDDRALPSLIDAAGAALTPTARRKLLAYVARHQPAFLATSASLTATTLGISGLQNTLENRGVFTQRWLKSATDYADAMAA